MSEQTAIDPCPTVGLCSWRLASIDDARERPLIYTSGSRGHGRGSRRTLGVVSAALLFTTGCGVHQQAPDPDIPPTAVSVPFASLVQMPTSNLWNEAHMVVRTRAEWADLWASATEGVGPAEDAPSVDFGRRIVLVAALGRRATGGFAVTIGAVFEDRERLYAVVTETSPGSSCVTTQTSTAPVAAISIPLSAKPVTFVRRFDSLDCD
ncbi:MAG: protease complex subunit PrcB family protein [Gemmatimonadales bacterium]